MIRNFLRSLPLILIFYVHIFVAVGPIVPGQAMWCINQRIASTVDIIESKVCLLDLDISAVQALLCSKLEVLDSVVDIVESKSCDIESKVEILTECQPIPFTATTTITASGFYCLASTNTAGTITVQAATDDVVVDLNGHRIEAIVIESNDQITFRNGTVVGVGMAGVGIDVQSGSTGVTLQDIQVQNAQIGIAMAGVVGGLIENCSMSLNFTGVELDQSHKITIDSSTASCNKNAGFCLLSSTTCCVINSKALSTGEGNSELTNQTIFGFVSSDGYANIFERCIANATHGLTVTDSQSLVAGFALRGTEGCSKIIGCESANAQTDDAGLTLPYGILLEASVNNPITLTGVPAIPDIADAARGVSWSADQKYLAISEGSSFGVYQWDTVARIVTRIAVPDIAPEDTVTDLQWSPDGNFVVVALAASDTYKIRIYQFCRITFALEQVVTPDVLPTGDVNSIDWDSGGNYLAVGTSGPQVNVYLFDRVGLSLTQAVTPDIPAAVVSSVSWSPDDAFIAAGLLASPYVEVFSVDLNAGTLTSAQTPAVEPTTPVNEVSFSPDGKYLAVGSAPSATLRVYPFDPNGSSLLNPALDSVLVGSLDWSGDGRYIAISTQVGGQDELRIYFHDRAFNSLQLVATGDVDPSANIVRVRFSPDGSFLAVGSATSSFFTLYEALSFPHKNVIKDNTVYCNGQACGIGISGSSVSNLIIGNTAYANPITPPIIGTNYAFVTNVFNQLFGIGPSALQNISVDGCVPLTAPVDLALILKQAKYEVGLIDSQLDVVLSKVCALQTEIDTLTECDPTVVNTLPTTLSNEGFYCLANRITPGALTINGNNIVVDMNGQTIDKLTIENNDQVTVFQGAIVGTGMMDNAVEITSATNITLRDVHASNAEIGINMFNVVGGTIENCSMSLNFTGVELDNSHKITIDSSTASCNKNAGFCLLSSTTCCVINSKAFSTGQGNDQTSNQTIFGFVSSAGYANIFENCIANGTQGLLVTDFDSLIAGFALRNGEGCSKIINCESANSMADDAGVNIPYGILLEATVNNPMTLTGVPPVPTLGLVRTLAWSPDQKYLAVPQDEALVIFTYDNVNRIITEMVSALVEANINSVEWHPDGRHIAIGTGSTDTYKLYVYELCPINNTLTQVAVPVTGEVPSGSIESLDWNSAGTYLAVGTTAPEILVFLFDRVAQTITQAITPIDPSGYMSDEVTSVHWSPDDQYLAVGIIAYNVFDPSIRVYASGLPSGTLTQIDSVATTDDVSVVRWSPDGKYLAAGERPGGATLLVYPFSQDQLGTVVEETMIDVRDLDWSPDGRYIAVGIESGDRIQVYEFDRSQEDLILVSEPNDNPTTNFNAVRWSPDGSLVAVGGPASNPHTLALYEILSFPSKNVIKDNTVYCNGQACGIGISGSSIKNLIIGNISYANAIHPTFVGTNYAFVTNVFNQLFGIGPSALQNISVDGCVPLTSPPDLALLLKQAKQKAIDVQTALDQTESKLCDAISTLDLLFQCDPTPITATTTLMSSGFYCLAASNNVGVITIAANTNDVVVDLNGHRVQAVVIENNDQVTFYNGTVLGDSMTGVGIDVQSGSSNITLRDVAVQNAQIGIQMTGVVGGLIEGCSMSQNFTGVELDQSHKITIDSSVASCNKNAGYCLIMSSTCCVINSKALSTGEGNTQLTDQTIFGFVSTDGYANIFERCIANSTQGLTVTDSQSLVAGFALRGSEGCSKIIECESANAQTDDAGLTLPYGILLQASVNNPLTLTGVPAIPDIADEVNGISWSPDQKYLAISEGSNFAVYQWDTVARIVTRIATPDIAPEDTVTDLQWSPDGTYLAVAMGASDASKIRIYQFCRINFTLEQVATPDIVPTGDVNSIDWNSGGNYLAVGTSGPQVNVYLFDRVGLSLTQAVTPDIPAASVNSVSWSPDDAFIAAGLFASPYVEVFSVDLSGGTLTSVQTPAVAPTTPVNAVAFSPDGKYLAVGSAPSATLRVYPFDPNGSSLINPALVDQTVGALDWSSDGRYIAIGTKIEPDQDVIEIYYHDRAFNGLQLVATANTDPGDDIERVVFSPDGSFIAVGSSSSSYFSMYEALSFPHKNVIKNNTVYCNGQSCGIGISGSSVSNMIIGNTAYSNPVNPLVVGTNYAFVTNVFNQLFGQGPSALQNISVDDCEPIVTPTDLGLLAKQVKAKTCQIDSQVDIVLSKVELLTGSIIDVVSPCAPTAISAGPIIDSGYYCLSADATGPFAITASNVVLDLNGKKITSGVTISGQDQIKLFNGTIEGAASIDGVAATNSTDIILENVTVKNSLIGVNFEGVTGGLIDQCTLTQNVTGVELDQSHKIVIDSSIANCNTNAGFCLIASSTCCVINSKALSTGEGNTQLTDQTIFGFVSSAGYANVFENCIANGTQGLSVTDFDSLVAGFALRNGEGCSKIINCESANTQVDAGGVTIPYGVLLEGSLSSSLTLTGVPLVGAPTSAVVSLDWTSDATRLVTSAGDTIQIYSLDFPNKILTQIASDQTATSTAVRWDPSGIFVAAGDTDSTLRVYQFCSKNYSLEVKASISSAGINALDWHPAGNYIATGNSTGDELRVYLFDRAALTLALNDSDATPTGAVRSVAWRPDGSFIATVDDAAVLRVFSFIPGTLASIDSDSTATLGLRTVGWSPDGVYLATAGQDHIVRVYSFDGTSLSAVLASSSDLGSDINSLEWSGDGRYIAIGTEDADDAVRIFAFDRVSAVTQVAISSAAAGDINELRWLPDGQLIAAGVASSSDPVAIYMALSFPQKNVINNNTVYCNGTGSGIGVSGSSIANMIINNTAYSNPSSPSVIDTSYAFVTNVFNRNFGQEPTLLQNIAVGDCEPIVAPDDLVLLAKQICYKISTVGSCAPTILNSSDVSGGTIALTTAGNYCLDESVTADIEITGTSIAVNLNDNCLTGEIIISGDDVMVYNGNVVPPAVATTGSINAGIDILQGANRTMIRDVVVDATTAPTAANIGRPALRISGTDSQISNCTLRAGSALDAAGSNDGTDGGSGIVLRDSALRTIIKNCVISGGDGGNGGGTSTFGNGGDGGHAIEIQAGSVSQVEIDNCLIDATGMGGAPGTLNGTRTGGRGGDGVSVDYSASGVAVHNCIIRNAGTAGLSATEQVVTVIDLPDPTPDISVIDTADGKAIDDLVTASDNLSVIFGNFADTIENPIVYNLNNRRATPSTDPANGDGGVLVSNPPDATAGGGNVIVNHIVNVFMGTSSS